MSGYQINIRKLSHHRRNLALVVTVLVLAGLIIGGWLIASHMLKTHTKLSSSKAVVTHYSGTSSSAPQTYSASDFSFQMPKGWSQLPIKNSEYNIYEWQNGKGANYATVKVFEDTIPTNFSVNRVIVVAANGNKITQLSNPSDNCATFTNGHPTNTQVGYPAKWQGAAFYCDLNNTLRDDVGITTASQINSVSLVGPTNIHRSFYFLYSDSSVQPNYADFLQMINSFILQ